MKNENKKPIPGMEINEDALPQVNGGAVDRNGRPYIELDFLEGRTGYEEGWIYSEHP